MISSLDNPINQIILSTFLKRKGIKYSVANNGQEAVDAWKQGDFHLVLMDIQLPVKDGIEATQEIRAMERAGKGIGYGFLATPAQDVSNPMSPTSSAATSPYELPVIIVALTASSLQSDRVNALAAGCNDFLTKPVSLVWLNQKLVEWGSMAYLSGFGTRRSMGSSAPSRENSLMQAVQEKTPEEKAAEAKAEKEAQKAKLMAMMQRRPPGLEKKPAAPAPPPIPAETVSGQQATSPSDAVPMASEGQEIPGQNKVQQVLQEVAPGPQGDPAAESAAVTAGEEASATTQAADTEATREVIPGSDIRSE
jgi:CheY-like chemotaxis protein